MLKEVYSNRDYGEALMIASLLRGAGFHPLNVEMTPHVSLAGADIYYYVQVPEEEFELAAKFLKEENPEVK